MPYRMSRSWKDSPRSLAKASRRLFTEAARFLGSLMAASPGTAALTRLTRQTAAAAAQLSQGEFSHPPAVSQRLHRYINSDLMPVFETIGDRLGRSYTRTATAVPFNA